MSPQTCLRFATIPSKALPLVQIRVVVLGGKAADGERPGLAGITGQLLKDGGAGAMSSRDLVTRIEEIMDLWAPGHQVVYL